jgi:hypothetical protein
MRKATLMRALVLVASLAAAVPAADFIGPH